MTPRKSTDPDEEVDGELPLCNIQTMHDLAPGGSSPSVSSSDSASTTRDGSRPPSPANNNDDPPYEIQRVFQFIQELGAGMDELHSRMDKFEAVLDHLELDGIRNADEIGDLKAIIDQSDRGLAESTNVVVRLERCEREQQCLADLVEQRQTELLIAAASDVDKACKDSLERYWAEAGVAQVRKVCEDTLQHLRLDLNAMAERTLHFNPDAMKPEFSIIPPKPSSPLPPRLCRENIDKEIDAACTIAFDNFLTTVGSKGMAKVLKELGTDQEPRVANLQNI